MNSEIASEEEVKIRKYGDEISKKLEVFYNPVMKLNRDLSLLVIESYFSKYNKKKIKYCDPMVASGIREIRFFKKIKNRFELITMGDISSKAIVNLIENFNLNEIDVKKERIFEILNQDALNTISKRYWDFIEIDPFGSPIPFLDIAFQRIKHNGIISVTATDTAALCGTYPKTTFRKYGMSVIKTLWFEELGLRNLIAYVKKQAAKYELVLTPILSYSQNHYYKVFFKVSHSRTKAYDDVKNLKYIKWDKKTQINEFSDYELKGFFGRTYIGSLNDKNFLLDILENIDLIEDKKKVKKLLNLLIDELDIVGYYNPHKFEREFKFQSNKKFEQIIKEVKDLGYDISKPHNNRLGLKTNCPFDKFIEIMKKD